MSAQTYEPTREKLQALWDRCCPNEPRQIVRARTIQSIHRGTKRYIWIAQRQLNDKTTGHIDLGTSFNSASKSIRDMSRWKGGK